jgi:hypothetical protein
MLRVDARFKSSVVLRYPFPVSRPFHPPLYPSSSRTGNRDKQKQTKVTQIKEAISNATHKPKAPPKKAKVKAGQGRAEKNLHRDPPQAPGHPVLSFRRPIDSRTRSIALAVRVVSIILRLRWDGEKLTCSALPLFLRRRRRRRTHQKQKKKQPKSRNSCRVVSSCCIVAHRSIHAQLTRSKRQATATATWTRTH